MPQPSALSHTLLQGLTVLDLAGEPLAMTGRMLADLGADVVKLEPAGGDPLRQVPPLDPASGVSLRFLAFNAGKTSVEYCTGDADIEALLQTADVVISTPGFPGALQLLPALAPRAVWLQATPFGSGGPRGNWRASDLGIMAASGNLYATGFADRPPVRCAEAAGYAHGAAEAVVAILTALARGRPGVVDLSLQEAVLSANMGGAGQFPKTGNRGRRQGAAMGRTREIWPCKDGYISFGLRGGPARRHNFQILLEQLEREQLATAAWRERDWANFNPAAIDDAELRAIEQPLAEYFTRHSMTELYQLAVATGLMLAPVNSAAQILNSEQLRARGFFAHCGVESDSGTAALPAHFCQARAADEEAVHNPLPAPAPQLNAGPMPQWPGANWLDAAAGDTDAPAWSGLKLLEFGSGAAGPIASRYFAEHGATVIKVESLRHPDFLRVMAQGGPHGLEGSTLYDALNVGKQSITLNLKHPEGKAIALRLVHWADAVLENFAPRVMANNGLDYTQLCAHKPDLVMLSTCLNGHSGPHRDYPGFGGQGAALAGYNYLTGWADREPIGPYGTITDSLAPRFAASALAAALLHRRRGGRGLHLDVSQVETGVYCLAPWLLQYAATGTASTRNGNRSLRAAPHGVFPCAGTDRWIAIACWNDLEWLHLATICGLDAKRYPDLRSRLAATDALEQEVGAYTAQREAAALARQLQYAGIEAVPVADFEDLLEHDAQLQQRAHFVPLERALTGTSVYERNGFRLGSCAANWSRPSPQLGEHTGEILTRLLGLSTEDIAQLRAEGALD